MSHKYAHEKSDGTKESWNAIADRTVNSVMEEPLKRGWVTEDDVAILRSLVRDRIFMPGGRYLYASGRPFHQTQNCLLLKAEDSREGWAELVKKATMALMTGAGIGVDYSDLREEGSPIKKTGGTSSGPLSLMKMVNEVGRNVMQGGSRRSAIWAGLNWKHPDVFKFIYVKDWSDEVRAMKEKDFNFPADLDMTNISVLLDDEFFIAYHNVHHSDHRLAHQVYSEVVSQMVKTAEPGLSVDIGVNAGETLRNACCEVTSRDDSDICNLGSIVLSRVTDPEQMRTVTKYATMFLLAGTVYSHLPYDKVGEVREKNRRLGLGLMGVHEWSLLNNEGYEISAKMKPFLDEYARSTEYAHEMAEKWGISKPIKTRAIAPTGTIGIVAETTTGVEPIFCVAYKRRFLKGQQWHYQYVVDPTAKSLIDSGVDPETIEDAYSLSEDVERRVRFQADLQDYVDHGISSTINLPAWGSLHNNEKTLESFKEMLIKYLPRLRGITCYPDGARGGQPLTPVSYAEAVEHKDQVFVEAADICDITGTGTCGS